MKKEMYIIKELDHYEFMGWRNYKFSNHAMEREHRTKLINKKACPVAAFLVRRDGRSYVHLILSDASVIIITADKMKIVTILLCGPSKMRKYFNRYNRPAEYYALMERAKFNKGVGLQNY